MSTAHKKGTALPSSTYPAPGTPSPRGLPYAITVAACSAVCYVITGLAQAVLGSRASLVTSLVLLVVAIVLELAVLSVIRARTRTKISGDAA